MNILQHTFLSVLAIALLSCNEQEKQAAPAAIAQTTTVKTTPENSDEREAVIAYAKKYMGTKYCYASSDPDKGFDCSGFVNFVYSHFDITLPRSSSGFEHIGKTLKPEEFKVGDIVVFYGYRDHDSVGHVGIICEANGMESKFIHASSGKEMAVTISDLDSAGYSKRFYRCINPFEL